MDTKLSVNAINGIENAEVGKTIVVGEDENNNLILEYGEASSAQIQSDWNQSDNTAPDFIKNKPSIPKVKVITAIYNETLTGVTDVSNTYSEICQYLDDGNMVILLVYYYGKNFFNTFLLHSGDNPSPLIFRRTFGDGTWAVTPRAYSIYDEVITINSDNSISFTKINKPFRIWVSTNNSTGLSATSEYFDTAADVDNIKVLNLHKISKTGSYNDLLDKPTIPTAQIQSDWEQDDTTAADYIKNKPTIPSAQMTKQTITSNVWNVSGDKSTFAYMEISSNTTLTIQGTSVSSEMRIPHILKIYNSGNATCDLTIQPYDSQNFNIECLQTTIHIPEDMLLELSAYVYDDFNSGKSNIISVTEYNMLQIF